ncbi:unnamed protein product [Candidula unifasciata]|uniref:UspA domain-containing protein n=1 Tax=Candidula unifasciata TaxID=100452 RepID=A0A8S3ZTG7_9EUPU|nr:unnamed protein product [Candidula unifasciata]
MADAASSQAVGGQRDGRGGDIMAVLIAVDGSDQSFSALDWYLNNIWKSGSKVIVAHCSDYSSVVWAPIMSTDSAAVSNMMQHCEDTTNNILAQIQQKLARAKIDAQLLRLAGEPGPAIVKAADEHRVDYIVTGTRGLGTLRRTLLGSVSSHIVHHAHCPVLVCPFKKQ